MEENAAALHTAANAVQALGKGFDVNFDTRLLYCKGVAGSKVVEIDEEHKRDLWIYDDLVVPNVSRDIETYQDPVDRIMSGVCSYNEVNFGFSCCMLECLSTYLHDATMTISRYCGEA